MVLALCDGGRKSGTQEFKEAPTIKGFAKPVLIRRVPQSQRKFD